MAARAPETATQWDSMRASALTSTVVLTSEDEAAVINGTDEAEQPIAFVPPVHV